MVYKSAQYTHGVMVKIPPDGIWEKKKTNKTL